MRNRTILLLSLTLLILFTLPSSFVNRARGTASSSMASFWHGLVEMKLFMQAPLEVLSFEKPSDEIQTKDQEIGRLLLENQLLGNEINYLKELVEQELISLQDMLEGSFPKLVEKEELSRYQKEVLAHFNLHLFHLPARVIYRPLNAWNSSLWIDKGEKDNSLLGRVVIAKNSPVVIGPSVVGVVDFVGEKQSRVRLITDSGLNLSVRVKRGKWLLAKGEMIGMSDALSRTHRNRLKGVGFNYDFADREGPARDLRTGAPLEQNALFPTQALVKLDDLIVTTGMDGVFPPNLNVGTVKKIAPLKEGDFAYDLEIEPSLKDLNSLLLVFVLPPI